MCENCIKKSVTTYISHLGQLEGTASIVDAYRYETEILVPTAIDSYSLHRLKHCFFGGDRKGRAIISTTIPRLEKRPKSITKRIKIQTPQETTNTVMMKHVRE